MQKRWLQGSRIGSSKKPKLLISYKNKKGKKKVRKKNKSNEELKMKEEEEESRWIKIPERTLEFKSHFLEMKKPRVQEPGGVGIGWEIGHCRWWEFRAMKMKGEGEMEVRSFWDENFEVWVRKEEEEVCLFVFFLFILGNVGGKTRGRRRLILESAGDYLGRWNDVWNARFQLRFFSFMKTPASGCWLLTVTSIYQNGKFMDSWVLVLVQRNLQRLTTSSLLPLLNGHTLFYPLTIMVSISFFWIFGLSGLMIFFQDQILSLLILFEDKFLDLLILFRINI